MLSDIREIYVVYSDDICVAFFYIDKVNEELYEAAASGVLQKYSGRGIGTKCVEWRDEIIKSKGGKYIQTWVSENNTASYKRFEKHGYIITSESKLVELPKFNRTDKFYKWIKEL